MKLTLFQEYQPYVAEVNQKMLDALAVHRSTSSANLFDEIQSYLLRPAKYLRPLTIMLIGIRLGSDVQKVIACGAAVELYHNATLIYDDIQDNAEVRRHQPAMHISNPLSLSMSIGAVTRSLMYHPVHSHLGFEPHELIYIHRVLDQACTAIAIGQGVEVLWRSQGRWNIKEGEYYEMIGGKTGALFASCCQMGAFLGSADPGLAERFYQFGMKFGVTFQLLNDYLDLAQSTPSTGRPAYEDLREAKNTLFVIRALQKLESDGDKETYDSLVDMLNQGMLDERQIEVCLDILHQTKSIQSVRTEIEERLDQLHEVIRRFEVPKHLKNDLVSMVNLLASYT